MKYIISESKLSSFIYNYLNSDVRFNKNWGPDFHDYFRKEIAMDGSYPFVVNYLIGFKYYGVPEDVLGIESETLVVKPWLSEKLDGLFGKVWVPIFVQWFKDGTGLPVSHFSII